MPKPSRNFVFGSAVLAIFLIFWEIAGRFWVNPLFISSPSRVIMAGGKLMITAEFYRHLWASGSEFIVGFILVVIFGMTIGVLIGWFEKLHALFNPLIATIDATPRYAFIPILLIWFGLGFRSKIATIIIVAVLPVIILMLEAVRNFKSIEEKTDSYIMLVRSLSASSWQIVRLVVIPALTPAIFASIRIAIARSLIGVFIAEMFASTEGLGFIIMNAASRLDVDTMIFGIAVLSLSGLGLTYLLKAIEKKVGFWYLNQGQN